MNMCRRLRSVAFVLRVVFMRGTPPHIFLFIWRGRLHRCVCGVEDVYWDAQVDSGGTSVH